MKIIIRKDSKGALSVYVPKKDLEETVVDQEKPDLWGGTVTLSNGWKLKLPEKDPSTGLPVTVEAIKI